MAEEKNTPHTTTDVDQATILSHDDVSALQYVLHHVKGSSPVSATLLMLEELGE